MGSLWSMSISWCIASDSASLEFFSASPRDHFLLVWLLFVQSAPVHSLAVWEQIWELSSGWNVCSTAEDPVAAQNPAGQMTECPGREGISQCDPGRCSGDNKPTLCFMKISGAPVPVIIPPRPPSPLPVKTENKTRSSWLISLSRDFTTTYSLVSVQQLSVFLLDQTPLCAWDRWEAGWSSSSVCPGTPSQSDPQNQTAGQEL